MKKVKNNRGFSLAETLLAILILLLVSVFVANGVPAAKSAYEKVVIGANAKVLLSTAISTLRDEIATARDVKVDSTANTVTYYSADDGATSKIYLNGDGENREVMLQEYIDTIPGDSLLVHTVAPHLLVSKQAATGDLFVTYTGVSLAENVVSFKKLAVFREADRTAPMAIVDELNIRIIKSDETKPEG